MLYMGAHMCPSDSLARLFLLAEELVFLDRPSVSFDGWGTIGHPSPMRQFSFRGCPVPISTIEPPGTAARDIYEIYAELDLSNPKFVRTFLDALKTDRVFADRLLPRSANYGDGLGRADLIRLLTNDNSLYETSFHTIATNPSLMFQPETRDGRLAIVKTLLTDVSIQVTAALLVAHEQDIVPVADDLTLPKLLALRSTDSKYVGKDHRLAPQIGLEFAKAVIPDQMLRKLDFADIFEYRTKSVDIYRAWNTEINKIAARMTEMDFEESEEAVRKLIATELQPKVIEYENELSSLRDRLFGEMIKSVVAWEVPTISISHLANLGYSGALMALAAGSRAAIPKLVDYVTSRREIHRKHAVSYLVGLSKL